MKDKIYIPGREDLSVTVFIPTDCTNNCRFCTSKASYSEKKPDLKKVIYSIKDFCKNDPFTQKQHLSCRRCFGELFHLVVYRAAENAI